MAKAIELAETRSGCAILKSHAPFQHSPPRPKVGQLYFNMRGYTGAYLPQPNGTSLDLGERGISAYRKAVAQLTGNGPKPKGTSPASDLLMSCPQRKHAMSNHRNIYPVVLLVVSIVAAMSIATAEPPADHKASRFLDHLKPRQVVSLTTKDGRYEIGVFPASYQPLPYKVVEIGHDYVVLRDLVEINDVILPIYAIKAIKVLRVGGK